MQSPVFGSRYGGGVLSIPVRAREGPPPTSGADARWCNDVFASGIAIIVLTLVVPWEVPSAAGLLAYHAEGAVKHGASRDAIAETLAMATYTGGGPSVMYAAAASEAVGQIVKRADAA